MAWSLPTIPLFIPYFILIIEALITYNRKCHKIILDKMATMYYIDNEARNVYGKINIQSINPVWGKCRFLIP